MFGFNLKKRFDNLPFINKLALIFSVVVIILIFEGIIGFMEIKSIGRLSTNIYRKNLIPLQKINNLASLVNHNRELLLLHLGVEDHQKMKMLERQLMTNQHQVSRLFSQRTQYFSVPTVRELEGFLTSWQELQDYNLKILEFSSVYAKEEAFEMILGKSRELFEQSQAVIERLKAELEQKAEINYKESQEIQKDSLETIIFIVLAGVLIILMGIMVIQNLLQEVFFKLKKEIQERKEISKTLQKLSKRSLSAHEAERKRISRELHDGIAQNLAALKLKLQVMTLQDTHEEETKEIFRDLILEISDSIEEISDIAEDLRPAYIEKMGFTEILKIHSQKVQEQHGIQIKIQAEDFPVDTVVKDNLYRIYQEALSNILKHSQATTVEVCLKKQDGKLHLSIQDNGRGFDMDQKLKEQQGLGLSTLRERAELLGGNCQLTSRQQEGTRIYVEVPLS